MKHLFPVLLLIVMSCGEEDPETARVAATCRLTRIEEPRKNEASTRTDIAYGDGKLNISSYYTAQPGGDWDYVETRRYTHLEGRMDIQITRPAFTINGSFILDSRGNLLEYSDDFFAHVFRYGYSGSDLQSDDKIRYVVRNGNIIERIEISSGRTIDRFTYDDRPNPLRNLFYEPIGNDVMEYFRFYNTNNVVTETIVGVGTHRYTYEYGPEGYPTKQTWVDTNRVTQYSYKCE